MPLFLRFADEPQPPRARGLSGIAVFALILCAVTGLGIGLWIAGII